jgi:hypothetical protein
MRNYFFARYRPWSKAAMGNKTCAQKNCIVQFNHDFSRVDHCLAPMLCTAGFCSRKIEQITERKTRFPFECNDFVTSDQMPSPHMNYFSFAEK